MTVYSYPTVTTTVDCEKQVISWRLVRSILTLLIPTCNCINMITETQANDNQECMTRENKFVKLKKPSSSPPLSTTITGTLYGSRQGKVKFCVQTNPNSESPIPLLLELAIPTSVLAKEMKGGSMRIAFEDCEESTRRVEQRSLNLFSVSSWTMYCNGKKVGFATKKTPSRFDVEVLRQIETISVGAGIIGHGVVYLRGKFERFRGSMNSESFHLIDIDHGNVVGQELSFYFLRSR